MSTDVRHLVQGQVTAVGRRAGPGSAPSVRAMLRTTGIPALLTLIGVPAGLALTGGNVQGVMTMTLAVWLAVALLFAGRFPVSVLVFEVLAVAAMRGANLVGTGWVWPATAGFVLVALAGRLRVAIVIAAITLGYGAIWDYVVSLRGFDWTVAHVGTEALWLAAALAAAQAWRRTRQWQQEMAARLAGDEHERELEAGRRRAEERVDIARDLHDVVSHTLAVVGVHLNVALDAFDTEPAEARSAIRLAQDVRGRAMSDLKALVDIMRAGPVPGLDALVPLAAQVREAGLEVTVTESGERADVPAPVATAVYRVVQEALTNTVRHARASRAVVTLRYGATGVVVDVQDDGQGAAAITDGHGIAGMRERVAALGGTLTAAPGKTGFSVRASIPIAG
jgi:signal transduction histidine kinase